MSDGVVNFERGLGIHWHDGSGSDLWMEISPGRCFICAYWPAPPPRWEVVSVDRDEGVITCEVIR